MRNYTVTKTLGTPDWSVIPVLSIDIPYLQARQDVRAYAQIAYDCNGLLLHQWMDVPIIRAEEYGPYGVPCEDSCLEFFFQPVPGDDRYINIEFNYNGCYYFGIGTCLKDLFRLIPEENGTELFGHKIQKTDFGWEIYYRIPYELIWLFFPGVKFRPGMKIRANCFACSDLAEPCYYFSWNPIIGEPFTFHRSESFGEMELANN